MLFLVVTAGVQLLKSRITQAKFFKKLKILFEEVLTTIKETKCMKMLHFFVSKIILWLNYNRSYTFVDDKTKSLY